MKIKILAILITLFLSHPAFSQISTQWVSKFSTNAGTGDAPASIALDNQGNVYVGGCSFNSTTKEDYLTIKYNSSGEELWTANYNGTASGRNIITAIAVDNEGNVYVTGSSEGKGQGLDYVTVKYNAKGEEQWVQRYNGSAGTDDGAVALVLDKSGNIYVTGYSTDAETGVDIVTIKYSPAGKTEWANMYDNPHSTDDYGSCLAVDETGNVYVGGYSETRTSGKDFTVLKYNSIGTLAWSQNFNGTANGDDQVKAIAADGIGNVIVTGFSLSAETNYDIITLKYDSAGNLLWQTKYNGPGNNIDQPAAMIVDKNGYAYVTGSSMDINDNLDYVTLKYSNEGAELWTARYNDQAASTDAATCIALDQLGSVYVSGHVGAGTDVDYATIKYNPMGQELWVAKYNGTGSLLDKVSAIAVDANGSVYVTGTSIGNQSYISTIKYIQTPPESSPTQTLPANDSKGVVMAPTLEWKAIKNADYFRLEAATDKSFTNMVIDTNISLALEKFTISAGVLEIRTEYYWRIGAVNAAGMGPWSEVWKFTTEP